MKELLEVARNRNLALLFSGRIVSVGGDFVYQIALSVAIFSYSHHNSVSVSLFWLARLLPGVFLGPWAGALADRYGYRRSMIVADLGRMVLVAAMAIVARPSTWIALYPLIFLVSCFGSLFNPASVGLVPSLVESREQRMAANVAIGEIQATAGIVGSVLGGVFAAAGFTVVLLLADAITFGISAYSLSLITVPSRESDAGSEVGADDDEVDEGGVLAGFRLISRRPLLVFAVAVMALPEFGSGAILVWIVPYAQDALHLGGAGVGYLTAALGVGAVVGGFAAALLGSTIRLDSLLALGVAVLGIGLIVFGVVHIAVVAIVCLVILGMAEMLEYAAYETLLQQAVPDTMIGRVAGSIDTAFVNLMLVGNLLSGILAATVGLTVSIVTLGVLTAGVAILAWFNLQRQVRGQPNPQSLEQVPAFAGVSSGVREWAVRRMLREQYAPGAVVIAQGETGDRFYTIGSGRAEVEVATEGASVKRELGPGDFFGEIALLQNVPRTATVRACDELTVYAMSREDFEELQERAVDFKNSLLETASARTEEDRKFRLTFASRLG